jgi:hypothetical protein
MTRRDRAERAEFRDMATELRHRKHALLKAHFEARKSRPDVDPYELQRLERDIESEFDFFNPPWLKSPPTVLASGIALGLGVAAAGVALGPLVSGVAAHLR